MGARPQPVTARRGDISATYDPAARSMGGVLLVGHRRPFRLGTLADARDLRTVLDELIARAEGPNPGGGWV